MYNYRLAESVIKKKCSSSNKRIYHTYSNSARHQPYINNNRNLLYVYNY